MSEEQRQYRQFGINVRDLGEVVVATRDLNAEVFAIDEDEEKLEEAFSHLLIVLDKLGLKYHALLDGAMVLLKQFKDADENKAVDCPAESLKRLKNLLERLLKEKGEMNEQ